MRGQLEACFDAAFTAPDGVKRLREMILTLAVQGKLSERRDSDEPAGELLKKIAAEKKKLEKEGKIKKQKPLPPVGDSEKPYALPKGWEWVRLGDVAEYIQRGKGPNYVEKSDYPVISQKSIQWAGFNKDVVRFVDEKSISSYGTERFIRNGDMLWNSTGTGTIGRINIYRGELSDYKKVVCDSHVTIVRHLIVSSEYSILFLMSRYVQNLIEAKASGTTNQIELNTSQVIKQVLPLPPLAEQQRIMERVNSLMARCDALEALHKQRENKRASARAAAMHALSMPQGNTDPAFAFSRNWRFLARYFEQLFTTRQDVAELRKTILQLAVMGKLTEQRGSDEPAGELLKNIAAEKKKLEKEGKIKKQKPLPPVGDSEKPYALPKGWEWVRLGDLGTTNVGLTYSPNDLSDVGTPVLRSTNIQNSKIDFTELKRVLGNIKDSALAQEGDLLICARNGSKSLVGKCAIIPRLHEKMAFGAFMAIFRSQINVYLFVYISSNLFRDMLTSVDTVTINQITQSNLTNTLVPLPPLAEQQRIVARVNALMALCDTLEKNMDACTQTQTRLLNALTGMA